MNEGLIPRRYAKALYKVAVERGDADTLYGIMNSLVEAAATQPSMLKTIANPFVSVEDKCALLFAAIGSSANVTFADFLKLLAQNKRLSIAVDIARDFTKLYRQERGIYKVEVVSAAPLDNDEENRLKKLIESHLNGGSMEYTTHVDPELIGGFTVSIDNERLNASVKNELKQLRLNLLK